MANQIRISPEQMRSRANEYRIEEQAVSDVITRMSSLLDNLRMEWEGQASEDFAARFNELKPGFDKARELIGQIAKALDDTANIVEETDREIGNQFRG